MTELGKNWSTTYLRGRIHLTDITKNYKEYQNFEENWDESNTITDPSVKKEFIPYDPNGFYSNDIRIRYDGLINCYSRSSNHLSAIAAVDYAMRETKPSCGLVKEFKIISK